MDRPVEHEKIEWLLEAGSLAPSAMNRQPCRFTVIGNPVTIRELSDKVKKQYGSPSGGRAASIVHSLDSVFYSAPLLIILSVPREDEKGWAKIDAALAAENMFLSAFSMGLGSCFIGFGRSLNNDPCVLEDLGVPGGHEIAAPLVFGYPKEWPPAKEKRPNVVKWIV